METQEIEAILQSNFNTFSKIENGYALVDGIYIDYSFSYLKNNLSLERVLKEDKIIVLPKNADKTIIFDLINELKNTVITKNFSLDKLSYNNYNVVINNEVCAKVSLKDEDGDTYFSIEYLSEGTKIDVPSLAKQLLDATSLNYIFYSTNTLYKENYYKNFLTFGFFFYKMVLKNPNMLFDNVIFTFKKDDFEKVS